MSAVFQHTYTNQIDYGTQHRKQNVKWLTCSFARVLSFRHLFAACCEEVCSKRFANSEIPLLNSHEKGSGSPLKSRESQSRHVFKGPLLNVT